MQLDSKRAAKEMEPQIIAWRRLAHAHPELRSETVYTEAMIAKALADAGVAEIRTGVGGHGVVATVYGDRPGKCLAIRADCDGLPIREETGLPFAATNGNMHACGHDAHTAMALGAATLLQQNREQLAGSVKFIFQPYEEGGCGAKAMIADGAMRAPTVDAIVGLHTGNIMGQQYDSGDVVVSPAPTSACIYGFKATFHGKSTHVCTPHLGVDPVFMACSAVVELQALLSREHDPNEAAIVSVCVISGGTRNNTIPDACTIEGSVRAFDRKRHAAYCERLRQICRSVAAGQRGTVTFETVTDVPATEIDPNLYRRFSAIAPRIVPPERIKPLSPAPLMGEDFAFFSDAAPALYFYLCAKPENGACYPHHHPRFDIDERQLYLGTALLTEFALHWQAKGATIVNLAGGTTAELRSLMDKPR